MRLHIGVMVLGVLALPGAVRASDWYVDCVAGSDTTGDGSLSGPWKTIQKGVDSAFPGDAVHVLPGTCTVFNAIAMRTEVSVIGSGPMQTSVTSSFAGVFDFADSIGGYTRSVHLADLEIRGNTYGVGIRTGSPTIENNVIRGSTGVTVFADLAGPDVAPLIESNTFAGSSLRAGATAAPAAIVVRRNRFLGAGGLGIFTESINGSLSLLIENNFIANQSTGVTIGKGEYRIVNNTIVSNGTGISLGSPLFQEVPSVSELSNNILALNTRGIFEDGPSDVAAASLANNDFFTNSSGDYVDKQTGPTDPNTLAGGTGNVFLDPSFVDASADDYHILSSSGLIDLALVTVAPPDDIDGDSRGRPDIGADEAGDLPDHKLHRRSVADVSSPNWKSSCSPLVSCDDPTWPRVVAVPASYTDIGGATLPSPLILWQLESSQLGTENSLQVAKEAPLPALDVLLTF